MPSIHALQKIFKPEYDHRTAMRKSCVYICYVAQTDLSLKSIDPKVQTLAKQMAELEKSGFSDEECALLMEEIIYLYVKVQVEGVQTEPQRMRQHILDLQNELPDLYDALVKNYKPSVVSLLFNF